MKKKLWLGVALLLPLISYAQVGVNTTTPQKTLHVNGSLQIANELNVGGNATTAGSAGTVGQVLKSNGPGKAPVWQTDAVSSNLYNSNGSLTGNRTVTQAGNTLGFTGTAINAFSVAGNTLSVDAANNRVGVGTVTPHAKLSVSGKGGAILSLTNTNVPGNPVLHIYPGYTSTGGDIIEGNVNGVVFDLDPSAASGTNQSLYDFHGRIRSVASSILSDRRLKTDIRDLNEYGVAEVMKLQPRRYLLKEYNTPDIGLIAQELQLVIPEIVNSDDSTGLLSVEYAKISVILINAIKEQQKMIEEQGKQIKLLQNKIAISKR